MIKIIRPMYGRERGSENIRQVYLTEHILFSGVAKKCFLLFFECEYFQNH